MTMTKVEIDVPEEIVPYTVLEDKEALFRELVMRHGFNIYLGAGFSVYARNDEGKSLPLGNKLMIS